MTEAIKPWEDRPLALLGPSQAMHSMEREIAELRARVAQQAAMVEKCMVAMNKNADRGMAAEARVAELEGYKKDAELWRAYKARKDAVIAAGMGRNPLRAAIAKGEKA